MKDIVKEHLGPVTLWNSITTKGREFLLKVCKASEIKQEGGFTYFQVDPSRNSDIENAAITEHIEVGVVP